MSKQKCENDLDKFDLETLFTETTFSIKDTGLSYKTISDWSKKELLSDFQSDKGKWHKFLFIDLVEVLIYKELRDMGVSIAKLKKLKKSLTKPICQNTENFITSTMLGVPLLSCVLGVDYFLILNKNIDSFAFERIERITKVLSSADYSHLVIISLRRLLDKIKIPYKKDDEKFIKLIELLSEEGFKDLKVTIEEWGNIKTIEETSYLKYDSSKKSLIDLIKSEKNQNITINTNSDGKITSIKRNRKIK